MEAIDDSDSIVSEEVEEGDVIKKRQKRDEMSSVESVVESSEEVKEV